MRIKHKDYPMVSGRIIQFVVRGNSVYAVVLQDYRKPSRGQKPGEGRFESYDIYDLIPDPPDYRMGL